MDTHGRLLLYICISIIFISCSQKSGSIEQYAPNEQLHFHAWYKQEGPARYISAQNEIVKSAIFNDILSQRYQYFKGKKYKIENWVGRIKSIDTPKGGAYVYAKVTADLAGMKIIYTNIPYLTDAAESVLYRSKRDHWSMEGGRVYEQLSRLKEGDEVVFSALVSESVGKDYGLMEHQDVISPRIAVRFTDVKHISTLSKSALTTVGMKNTELRSAVACYKQSFGGDHDSQYRLRFIDNAGVTIDLMLDENDDRIPTATIELVGQGRLKEDSYRVVDILDKHYRGKLFSITWHLDKDFYGKNNKAFVLDSMILANQ